MTFERLFPNVFFMCCSIRVVFPVPRAPRMQISLASQLIWLSRLLTKSRLVEEIFFLKSSVSFSISVVYNVVMKLLSIFNDFTIKITHNLPAHCHSVLDSLVIARLDRHTESRICQVRTGCKLPGLFKVGATDFFNI